MAKCEICKEEIVGKDFIYLEKWPQYKFCSQDHCTEFLNRWEQKSNDADNTTAKIIVEPKSKKRYLILFFEAFICLFIGVCCHALRTSGDPVKTKIGVVVGILMIVAAISFGIAGIIVAVKDKKSR